MCSYKQIGLYAYEDRVKGKVLPFILHTLEKSNFVLYM